MALSRPSAISVEAVDESNRRDWDALLAASANGTLFHNLRFLDYHPKERFAFRHFLFRKEGKPIALLTGALSVEAGQVRYVSTPGASVGGLVVKPGLRAPDAVALFDALKQTAESAGWAGIQVTVPPQEYAPDVAELLSFAVFASGFRLEHRWLCHLLPLETGGFEAVFRQGQISPVRTARRKGAISTEGGTELIEAFLPLFRETYARHGVPATHTEEEIRDLLDRLPDRIRIHLSTLDGTVLAGLLVFRLTPRIATTFYICTGAEQLGTNGAAVVIADAMDRLAADGFAWLDLGPSASDMKLNRGVTFFKEGLGGVGKIRDRWRWDRS